jgi:hypothetical protein
MDVPEADALAELAGQLEQRRISLLRSRLHRDVHETLDRSGVAACTSAWRIHRRPHDGAMAFVAGLEAGPDSKGAGP